MKSRKSQAALEYLTTYGWAFVVIIIIISAISYYGVLDFDRYLPKKCEFTSQFPCQDYLINSSANTIGTVKLRVRNNIGSQLRINNLEIQDKDQIPITCSQTRINYNIADPSDEQDFVSEDDPWEKNQDIDIIFPDCQNSLLSSGERFEANVIITFFAPGTQVDNPDVKFYHELRGTISGNVESLS